MILVFLAGTPMASFWSDGDMGLEAGKALATEGNGRRGLDVGNAGPLHERPRLTGGRDEGMVPLQEASGDETDGRTVLVCMVIVTVAICVNL